MKLRLSVFSVIGASILCGCVATEPVGGTPATETTGNSTGDATDDTGTTTQTATTDPATTGSPTTAASETGSSSSSGGDEAPGSSTSSGGGAEVPCAERTFEDCDGPIDIETDFDDICQWFPSMMHFPADSCEPVAPDGACLQQPTGGREGCAEFPTCEGVQESSVFYREREDGVVDIVASTACGFTEPAGFQRCGWGDDFENPTDMVTQGPAACDCAC